VRPEGSRDRHRRIRSARHWLSGGCAALLLATSCCIAASQSDDAAKLLLRADGLKTADPGEFASLLQSLDARSKDLSPSQLEFLRYLRAWKAAYDGHYDVATPELQATVRETHDVTLKFRATAVLINVLLVGSHYEEAFTQLTQLLTLLPKVTDGAAREQALAVATQLYNEVGQYDLASAYAQKLIDENWHGRGVCKGWEALLRARALSGRSDTVGPEFASAIDACTQLSEMGYANFIRTWAATIYIAHARFDEAIRLLSDHYAETQRTGYRHLISSYDALLAEAYLQKGNLARARQFALSTIASSVRNEFTQPLVLAYRLLYGLAKQQGDYKLALEYHEKYAAADKAYLDVITARQLAYQRVAHESVASKAQIDILNRENHVLQLERALGDKAVENSRLYIVLLLMASGFIALWAYRTKRLQLHFMSLSQIDGLTGIANRPHFIKRSQDALESASRAQQPVCMMLCDLDHFKSINDRYGHAAGDLVLKRAVAECQNYLRPGDIFGRFGGEEFGFLLPGCALEDACLRAEQMRLMVSGIPASDGSAAKASASFGIAATASSGYDLRRLLADADSALYSAKRAGRNRVAVFDNNVAVMGSDVTESGPTPVPSAEGHEAAAAESDVTAARILGITGS